MFVIEILHVGKEANRWEQQRLLGLEGTEVDYGRASLANLEDRIRRSVARHGEREATEQLGIARMTLRKILRRGLHGMSQAVLEKSAR